jgi:hypothetical protein
MGARLQRQGSVRAAGNPGAMSEPRAQRTLVKSPPELWAEVSDAGTLARHLGEFGDIRITRLEAETTVVWEGDRARGTVELEASGWGTKVTITASAVAEEEVVEEPEVVVAEEPAAETPPVEEEPEPVAATTAEEETEERTESVAPPGFEETPTVTAPTPARKRGFWARLFGRKEQVEVEPIVVEAPMAKAAILAEPESLVAVAVPVAPEPEPEPVAEEAPAAIVPPEPEDVEIVVTAMDDEQVEAVLVAVLDDLGSAHHRPFSRG